MNTQLNTLRAELTGLQNELIEAEADLTDQLAEITAFEVLFETKVGHLMDKLAALEEEIQTYNERIRTLRNRELFGNAHTPVADQYRRAWRPPPPEAATPPPQPLGPAAEAEIKQLYRQLARRFHPDLARDEQEQRIRTEKMQLINDAYAARSLPELLALAQAADAALGSDQRRAGQSEAQLVAALEAEIKRCRRRLKEINKELRNLRYRASVELSLEVKSAQRRGQDLLAEMATQLEQKIARRSVERDMLKAQFDQLGPDQGFIHIPGR